MLTSNTSKGESVHSLMMKPLSIKENMVRNEHPLEVQVSPGVLRIAKIKIGTV